VNELTIFRDTRFRALVFDWDGTIIDSTRLIVESLQGAARDLGFAEPSKIAAAHMIGLPLAEAARRLLPDIVPAQTDRFIELYRDYYFKKDASLQPYEGIPELLDELAAWPVWLAVATGKSRHGLVRALHALRWDEGRNKRFVSLRCGDDGQPKPHPWMLLDLAEELGIDRHEMLMIGDTTHDLGMARAAGVEAVAVTYGAQPRSELESFMATGRPGDPAIFPVTSVADLRQTLLSRLNSPRT
jgi:phosphoglycolate phosphatase